MKRKILTSMTPASSNAFLNFNLQVIHLLSGRPIALITFVMILFVSCSDKEDNFGIDRSALIGTWTGKNYECLFDKPGAVKLIITKGADPAGLTVELNGDYVVQADYGQDGSKKSFIGDNKTSSYDILISGILYEDGNMELTVLVDDDACDATLRKQ